jgi:hypothetical protein
MEYQIKAIETKYAGVNFRSRLEAKWAAMFDLLRWEWTYEPCDFNGWIPDFAIRGSRQLVYVEVKPVGHFPEEVASEIDASGCDQEPLIVGVGPFVNYDNPMLGWLNEKASPESWWSEAVFGRWREGGGTIGFCHSEGVYDDRITGSYDGGSFGASYVSVGEIAMLWREAGNRTRWTPR